MTATAPIHSHQHWHAHLDLCLQNRNGRSVITRASHQGPLRIQRPFYPEPHHNGDLAHVYLLHPPGGIVGGDTLDIHLHLAENSQGLFTTPGSTKIYRSAGDTAIIRQRFHVKPGASLEWLVQDNILFPGARLDTRTEVNLEGDARFIGWDITCLGRPQNQERFSQGYLFSRLSILRDGMPLLMEQLRLDDGSESVFELGKHGPAMLRGHAMQATFCATHCGENELQMVRDTLQALQPGFPIAATLLGDLLVVRALGQQTESLQGALIPLWQHLRPRIMNRPAVRPRIWNT